MKSARKSASGLFLVAGLAAGMTASMGDALAQDMAQDVKSFYEGRQMRMIIFASPGGGYDSYARLLARHIVNHIPGAPSMVASNMPGAGGIKAVNYVAKSAPADGSVMTMVNQGIPMHQALIKKGLQVDVATLNWIGNISYSNQTFATWAESGFRTLEDAKEREMIVGATGIGSSAAQLPAAYNYLLGLKLKVIYGYPGGNEMNLAMERGEIHARGTNPLASWKATTPEWLSQKKLNFLIQVGLEREPELPDVPLLTELAKGDKDREAVARFLTNNAIVGRPFAVAPGVPENRVAALRAAYDRTVADKTFLEDANKQRLEIRSMSGDRLQALVHEIVTTPPNVLEMAKAAVVPRSAEKRNKQ